MTVEDLQKISLSLPGVTEDIKWESHLCFSIGGKMFLETSPDIVPRLLHLKYLKKIFMKLLRMMVSKSTLILEGITESVLTKLAKFLK